MAKTFHVVSVLDRSGSMQGTENEVIGAYNNFIQEQQKVAKEKGVKIKATLVLFDDKYEEVYSKKDIRDVPELNSDVYYTRGMTALYDAIGKSIANLGDKKNVIFFIETDGCENASQEFSKDKIEKIVKAQTDKGWDFNFVGADLDQMTVGGMAQSMGISAAKTMAFAKTSGGYATRNQSFSASLTSYVDEKTG